MVAEKTVKMTGVKYPAEGFSESVRRVDHTGDVGKEDVTTVFPVLGGIKIIKKSDVYCRILPAVRPPDNGTTRVPNPTSSTC
jgi:hypothetical protein